MAHEKEKNKATTAFYLGSNQFLTVRNWQADY